MTTTLTDTNFEQLVLYSPKLVLVSLWADWCGSCKMLNPIIETLAEDYSNMLSVGRLNVDTDPETAKKYGLNYVPAILFFKNGQLIDSHTGALPPYLLTTKINKLLTGTA